MFVTATSMSPSLSKSAKARAAAGMLCGDAQSRHGADVFKPTVSQVAVDQSRLAIGFVPAAAVEFRIHVAVHLKNILPAVVVEIH